MNELYPYGDFAARFKELIKDKKNELGRKVTQDDLALALDCKQSFISQMTTGKKLPSTDTALLMRDYFKCSLDWLLAGVGDKYCRLPALDDIGIETMRILSSAKAAIDEHGEDLTNDEKLKVYRACTDFYIGKNLSHQELAMFVNRLLASK